MNGLEGRIDDWLDKWQDRRVDCRMKGWMDIQMNHRQDK